MTTWAMSRCRLLWGVIAMIVLVLVLSILVPWWLQLSQLQDRLDRDQAQLVRYQRLLATLPQLRAELEQVKQRDDTKTFYFSAPTPALAGAQLQSELQDIIRSAGARPVSTQILPVDAREQPPVIRVRLQLQGATAQVFDVLYRIERARPFLFIEQMSLHSAANDVPDPPRPAHQNLRQVPSPRERDELTVRLDILGFVLGENS